MTSAREQCFLERFSMVLKGPATLSLTFHHRLMASITLAARAYQQSFDARPYTTLAFTNGTLNAIGDIAAQIVQIAVSIVGD